jgi:peptidase E
MKQIIAIGSLTSPEENTLLFQYILNSCQKERPRICFVTTAQGDNSDSLLLLYSAFAKLECKPSHLSLLFPDSADLHNLVFNKDIILVAGGNTKNMLALWREWGLDEILHAAYEDGIVMAGWSAGAICWFVQGLTDSIPGSFTPLNGLGWLPGSCTPHYDYEPERRPVYQRLIAEHGMQPGIAIEDGAALHFVGGFLDKVVSSRPNSKAYSVGMEKGIITETELPSLYLAN